MKQSNVKTRISILILFSILFLCLTLFWVAPAGRAAQGEGSPEPNYIHSAEDFAAYASAYAAGQHYPNDTLIISISSGSAITDSDFVSLGTASRPFCGTLVLPASVGLNVFRLWNCPLFDYVSTEMTIGGSGVIEIIRENVDNQAPAPIFANHVVSGSTAASWNVSLLPYSGEGTAATECGALIGDVAQNANVSVTFKNTAPLNFVGSDNLGLICGTLGAGASLSVSTAGSSGSNVTLSTSSGSAGGLVGAMNDGATLTLSSQNLSRLGSITTSSGYVGGLVGNAINPTIAFGDGVSSYALTSSVTGTSGAGGIFGHYKTTRASETFSLEKYALAANLRVSSSTNTGGVFGYLESECAALEFDGEDLSPSFVLASGTRRGGVCGLFSSNALSNVFHVHDLSITVNAALLGAAYSGGIIGAVSNSPAYLKFEDLTLISAASPNAGLIGNLGSGGSFADVMGLISVQGVFDAGLIGNMPEGVLRIKGTTDLSLFRQQSWSSGAIVRDRGRALIYAAGNGEGRGWTLKRYLGNTIDDVRAWGEVVRAEQTRVSGTVLLESDLFTEDSSAHTITLKQAYPTMTTVTQLALTALNVQLNTSGTTTGALRFTSGSANTSSTLLGSSSTLTIGANLSFEGTGLTGFTRDDGGNAAFAGTLNGKPSDTVYTLSLKTGEPYGCDESGNAVSSSEKQGNIYRHLYNGLFAKTKNATVQNVILSGTITLYQSEGEMRVSALAAQAESSLTMTGVTVNVSVNYVNSGDHAMTFGAAVGVATGTGLKISIDDCDLSPVFTDNTLAEKTIGTKISLIGGAIGRLTNNNLSNPTQDVSVSDSSISLTYSKTINTRRPSCFGGVIAEVGNTTYEKSARQNGTLTAGRAISIDTLSLSVTATGTAAGEKFGGLLGMSWLSADVTIDGLTVVSATITSNGNATATPFGGLTQTATGKWDVRSVSLTSCVYSLPSNGSSFGFIANKTFTNAAVSINSNTTIYPESALYLDVIDASYDISALSFGASAPTFSVYDELVVSGIGTGANVTQNGNSVISVTTSGNAIDVSGSTFNTYLNKTAVGRSANGQNNPNVRYYYNIAYARANTATSKYDFLIRSVEIYAHPSLEAWFASGNSFSGSLDMTGLSYYPVDLYEAVSFSSATITLNNKLTDDSVKYVYHYNGGANASDSSDTTSTNSRHYLMHTSILRDAIATVTLTNVTIRGNVPKISQSGVTCGFLIAGTLGGSETVTAKLNLTNVTFNNAYISTDREGTYLASNAYAPLLVNKIGKKTNLSLDGASFDGTAVANHTAYASYAATQYAASSLIGDVGNASAVAIYLKFTGLVFDGRSSATAVSDEIDDGTDYDAALTSAYGTSKSLFSRATVLNSFAYLNNCSGSYNFRWNEDWADASTAIHEVTYGKEITTSAEHRNEQKHYYSSTYFTHPTESQVDQEANAYDFENGFLPYVYSLTGTNEHEISVNIFSSDEIAGSGKYGDPFVIDNNTKLANVAAIINGDNVGSDVKIYLPSDLTVYNYTSIVNGSTITKSLCAFGESDFTFDANGATAYATANVRRYLAGAYYDITSNIELANGFVGLGRSAEGNAEYAFRGVLFGHDVTITNHSQNPLIHTSMGSVVKNLTVEVDVENQDASHTITLAAPLGSATFDYNGVQSYGAVIGQILGGDTFIDKVDVTFTNVAFNVTTASSSNYPRLTPIGGYVGALVNGGLIFRNMTSSNVGLTAGKYDRVAADSGYLYVNPIIGRVIAGYAFHEAATPAYHATESSTTLKNGTKNYSISDLNPSESNKLSVTTSAAITVPNGQALFVLGAIVNSGAANASFNATTEQAYQAFSGSAAAPFWSAYREHTTARAGATYDKVGDANFASESDFTTLAVNDNYADKTNGSVNRVKIPYVIRAYTNSVTTNNKTVYPARCVSTSDSCVITITGNCDVAQGFRGIGSIYLDNNHLRLRLSSLTGATGGTPYAYTVTLHIDYKDYDAKNVSSYHPPLSNNLSNVAGLGLFNTTVFKTPASSGITNLILAGSVDYDVCTVTGGAPITRLFSTSDENGADYEALLSVGGVIGYMGTPFYIKNVTFNEFSVSGAKSAGGLVGYTYQPESSGSTNSQILFDASAITSGSVSVTGGLQAGGLVGRLYRAHLLILGNENGYTDIILKNIVMNSATPHDGGKNNYSENITTGAGGLVGACWPKHNDKSSVVSDSIHGVNSGNTMRRLTIKNINVTKGSSAATVTVSNDTGATQKNFAGGFVGTVHNALIFIEDCKLTGVNVHANNAGGLIGKATQKSSAHIRNVEIDGQSAATIDGASYAGGVVAWIFLRDEFYIEFANVVVKNYTILSSTTNNQAAAAGGIIGCAAGNNKGIDDANNHVCELNHVTVDTVTIQTYYSDTNNNGGTGGFIGILIKGESDSNRFKFSGYDLLIKDSVLSHKRGGAEGTDDSTAATNRKIGDLVGNNACSSPIKFVGVSVQNETYCGKHIGYYNSTAENYGSGGNGYGKNGGYVVFANFLGATGGTANGSVADPTSNADDYTNVSSASPYVTANPTVTIPGGLTLTGDGVASSVSNLPIQSILTDQSGLYAYAANQYYSGSSGNTNKQTFNGYIGKLSMLKNEVTGYNGALPILILDDSTKENSHKMINSYLRLLTNTRYDFGTDVEGVFGVTIYNVAYDNGAFTTRVSGASLQRMGGQFYMTNATVDSGNVRFSLIDLRFYDPAKGANESETVAYHLYVPVFVKKVLSYSFDVAVQNGTTYLETHYHIVNGVGTNRLGQALIENVGTPVTLFFQYSYSRNASEWSEAINAGESVHRNYGKTLSFMKANDTLPDFPSGTVLVLVDKNRGGKPYYATVGSALSNGVLSLSAFRDSMTPAGVIGGSYFSPVRLEDLLTITVSSEGEGEKNLVQCDAAQASLVVGGQGYRLATAEDDALTKYAATVTAAQSERYYLSIFTSAADTDLHYYLITTPSSFTDSVPPAKISDTGAHTMVHLVMGKIFYHNKQNADMTLSSTSSNGSEVISSSNSAITVSLRSELGLNDELSSDLKTDLKNLLDSTTVYQSFLIYLNRKEGSEIAKAVLGTQSVTGSYTLNVLPAAGSGGSPTLDSSGAYSVGNIRVTQNYIEVVSPELSRKFSATNNFEIRSSVVITYTAAGLLAQFPGRNSTFPENGVTVSASSNIAFSAEGTTYSKNAVEKSDPSVSYYSEAQPLVASLDLNAISDSRGNYYTPLGINALNLDDPSLDSEAHFDLLAVVDASAIESEVAAASSAFVTIKLRRKGNDGEYGNYLTISDYLPSISIEGEAAGTDNGTNYTFNVTHLSGNGSDFILPDIHFTVKTGHDFESAQMIYSNYRVDVEVVLKDNLNQEIAVSRASNYVIYTNAKVLPYYLG